MIEYEDGAKELIESRGLKAEDIEYTVTNAGDNRICNGEDYIAKRMIGETTVYARYRDKDGTYTIITGYSHKMSIADIVLVGEDTEWRYCLNGARVKKGHTNLMYLGATRSGPSLVEPTSGESWFEEYMAKGALTAAEGLFQQKRA